MTFRKTTVTVGALLALGLNVGTAEEAAAAGACGKPAGYHGAHQARMMIHPGHYGHGYAMGPGRMMQPMAAQPAMYWGGLQAPPVTLASTEAGDGAPADIVDTAVAAGSFETLAAALQAADLVETLKGEGPFTVFAPTDDAFAKIPQEQLEALLADKEKLTAVLTYHVVPGKVMAADVAGLDSAVTVQGGTLTIDTTDGVKVNGANVVKTDIEASNGVIHVIDAVLLPE